MILATKLRASFSPAHQFLLKTDAYVNICRHLSELFPANLFDKKQGIPYIKTRYMDSGKPIGIFDSGIGGLTVLHSIINSLPREDTIYLGDTARVPYGTKSADIVIQYSLEIGNFLFKMNIKALVVACNTASAVALPKLKERLSVPVIGMIEPAAEKAAKITKSGAVGIIGTEGTVRSGAYEKSIKKTDKDITVVSKSCPLFVPLAEEGWVDNEVALLTAEAYLREFIKSKVDTLILGCTHYPLFKETIKKVVGPDIALVDSGEEAAKELKKLLEEKRACKSEGPSNRQFYVTDTPERFLRLGKRFLSEEIGGVDHVNIPAE